MNIDFNTLTISSCRQGHQKKGGNCYSRGVPHFPQNFDSAGRLAPQLGHVLPAVESGLLRMFLLSFGLIAF